MGTGKAFFWSMCRCWQRPATAASSSSSMRGLQPENAAYKEPLGGLAPPYAVCNKHAEVPECCIVGYHSIEGSVTHAMPDFLYVGLCICSFLILLLPQSCFPNQIGLHVADTEPRIQVSAFWT